MESYCENCCDKEVVRAFTIAPVIAFGMFEEYFS